MCGSGFISHVDAGTGEETCLDINECLTIDAAQLDANCTCERCACKNVFGSYQCACRSLRAVLGHESVDVGQVRMLIFAGQARHSVARTHALAAPKHAAG